MGDFWQETVDAAVALRRSLHQQPELTWQEEQTAIRIRQELDALGIPWRAVAGTGTVGSLAAQASGPHIALRADIDALPIVEESEVAWRSQSPGVMHACGHDGHTATLMAAAAWLKQQESLLKGPVSLLFQPAEEGGHGARRMIEDGALQGVDWIFGWHNWPAIPFAQALCPDGTVMCANASFSIHIQGVGGHASQPEACRDPVLAGAAIAQALQQIVSRRLAPQMAAVVSVTSIATADSADTIIADSALLKGSIRAQSSTLRSQMLSLIEEIAESTARAYGVQAEVSHRPRYNATVNHPEAAERMRRALAEVLGSDWQSCQTPLPIMASEDFSYYLDVVPGAFALIGADGSADAASCHSPRYDFNDRLIPLVASVYSILCGVPAAPVR